MALQRREVGRRREPVFDVSVEPDARPRGRPAHAEQKPRPRRPAAKPQRGSVHRTTGGPPRKRRKRGSSGGRGRGGGGSGRRSLIGRIFYWSIIAGIWGAVGVAAATVWIGAHLPPIQTFAIPKRPPTVKIVGLGGKVIATRGEMPGPAVPLSEMPKYLPQAFIAIEDRRFYEHFGIDPIGVLRAVYADVLHLGVAQGGSTITQQLAKNLFLTQQRTFERKIQELVLALWLERKYTKNQILDVYLNRMYFGAGAYGVEAAAQRYFHRSARNVTLLEAAMLAGLVKSPSRLAPTRNLDGAEERAKVVLHAMVECHFITPEQEAKAEHQTITIAPQQPSSANYVADWIMDELDDRVGRVNRDLIVQTTIDPTLQTTAAQALKDEVAQKGAKYKVSQGAVVAMTPNGAVRALVGGVDYGNSQFNRAISAKRQPGSAFKPFVYLTALEHGLTPDSVRVDGPISVRGWHPENYSHHYHGPVTLTEALALSLNTVSVRLTLEIGPRAVVRTAHRLGIASKLEPNASIALGTSGVSLIEMVGAYSVFANGGFAVSPHVIEQVRTASGNVLYRRSTRRLGRIVNPRLIAMMDGMMHEVVRAGTARRVKLPGWPVAGKTGTSQDFRDAWFIGFTPHLVTGVWLGNDNSTPMRHVTGGSLPIDIWNKVMQAGHRGVAVAGLPGTDRAPVLPTRAQAIPPATIPDDPYMPTDVPPPPPRHSLDGWLLNRIFGR